MTAVQILTFVFYPRPWGEFIDLIGDYWEGTPYMEGISSHRRGVDCVRFVCNVLDGLYGESRVGEVARIKGDVSLHNKRGVMRAMRAILTTYDKHERVRDNTLEPGDVVVTGPSQGGPGHVLIAGGRQGVLWHCAKPLGVHQVGYSMPSGHKLFAVYRATDRGTWC